MSRLFAGILASIVYWAFGLAVWSVFFLADELGDCLGRGRAICLRDKHFWLVTEFAILAGMVLIYGAALLLFRWLTKTSTA